MVATVAFSGCLTIGGDGGTPTEFLPWDDNDDQRFRITFSASKGATQVSLDVRSELAAAGLEWANPGVPVADLVPAAESVVLRNAEGIVPADAAWLDDRLVLDFNNAGGTHAVTFDVDGSGAVAADVDGKARTAKISGADWRGADLWGFTNSASRQFGFEGMQLVFEAHISNNARGPDGTTIPVAAAFNLTAPDAWDLSAPRLLGDTEDQWVHFQGTVPGNRHGSDALQLRASGTEAETVFWIDFPGTRGVRLDADGNDTYLEFNATSGETVAFDLQVTNTGKGTDTYGLSWTGPAWTMTFEGGAEWTSPAIASGATQSVAVRIQVPSDAAVSRDFQFEAVAQADDNVRDPVTVRVNVAAPG